MDTAGIVVADRAIPAITITGNPCVDFLGEKTDPGNEQDPRDKLPTWEKHTYTGPGVCSAVDVALRINCQHPLHCFIAIDFRIALRNGRFVQIEEFDAPTRVETPHTSGARAA